MMPVEVNRRTSRPVVLLVAALSAALALAACATGAEATKEGKEDTKAKKEKNEKKQYDAPPEMQIDVEKKYTATLETDRGKVVVELFAKDVPKAVNNFVFLAREGFYDDTIFHRVIAGFMAQGGDPTGTGRGGPGYAFEHEDSDHKHDKGALAMANHGPDTNGSQFYITTGPAPHLDSGEYGKYTVFGKVLEGQDVVDSIRKGDKLKAVTIEEAEAEEEAEEDAEATEDSEAGETADK